MTFKATIAKTAFTAASVTENVVFITLPIRTRIFGLLCDTTEAYVLGAGTLVMKVTTTASDELIADHDVKTAATRQDVDQGGFVPSYTATSQLQVTLTSSSGNLGNGTATLLTAGSTDIYITVERIP